jgi:hypothetical protein
MTRRLPRHPPEIADGNLESAFRRNRVASAFQSHFQALIPPLPFARTVDALALVCATALASAPESRVTSARLVGSSSK